MAVTYKDIDDLSQKSTVAGTEKLPVSDTQYITPEQIAVLKRVHLQSMADMPASPDANTLYLIDEPSSSKTIVVVTPAQQSGVLVGTISVDGVSAALYAPQITVDSSLSASSENPVQNKVIYATLGDIETLLAAL